MKYGDDEHRAIQQAKCDEYNAKLTTKQRIVKLVNGSSPYGVNRFYRRAIKFGRFCKEIKGGCRWADVPHKCQVTRG